MSAAHSAMSWRTPAPKLPRQFQIGQFVTLPVLPANSILKDQRHITGTACKHPLVIVGMNNNGTRVTILQVTSFGGQLIDDKYHDNVHASRTRKSSYLAIDHGSTKRHSEHRPLKLVFDTKMEKQSYVNLDQFFAVEAEFLVPWKSGRHQIDSESISTLEKAFLDFVTGVIPRPEKTMDSVDSPFNYWSQHWLTASYLGVRPLSRSPAMPCGKKAAKTEHPAFSSQKWRAKIVRAAL